MCDWPWNAKCTEGTTTTMPPTTTRQPLNFNCTDKPSGIYPDPENCETFYKCSIGNSYLYRCPTGLHFNPTLLVKFNRYFKQWRI